MKGDLERKLKRERVEVCLNCKKFVGCDDIGKFEECADFEEVEEAWVIRKLDKELNARKNMQGQKLEKL